MTDNTHRSREDWLRAATDELRPMFAAAAATLPTDIHFSIAFTFGGGRSKAIGEAWDPTASDDGFANIIVRADRHEPVDVLAILVHELVHTAVGVSVGHGKQFKRLALAVGLVGKIRSTQAGEPLKVELAKVIETIGPLPHGKLNWDGKSNKPPKQAARNIKFWCPACEWIGRTARTNLIETGPPECPRGCGPMTWDKGEEAELQAAA
jgi:hypothetical protein